VPRRWHWRADPRRFLNLLLSHPWNVRQTCHPCWASAGTFARTSSRRGRPCCRVCPRPGPALHCGGDHRRINQKRRSRLEGCLNGGHRVRRRDGRRKPLCQWGSNQHGERNAVSTPLFPKGVVPTRPSKILRPGESLGFGDRQHPLPWSASRLMPRICRPLLPYFSLIETMCGASAMHGPHQVAQKSTTMILRAFVPGSTDLPSTVL